MKKTLTEIFRSSESFLSLGKTGALLIAVLFSGETFKAQKIIDPFPYTYDIVVKRQDSFWKEVSGHVHSDALLEMKIGPNALQKNFIKDVEIASQTYSFPLVATLPGAPPITQTFKIHFPSPGLTSLYYPIPTAVGGSTTIIPGCWTPEMDRGLYHDTGTTTSYGYGVTLTRTASAEYILQCTQFSCYICQPCPPVIPTFSKSNSAQQNKTKLYPNPSSGFSELEYTASGKETITVMVTDIAGKTLYGYKTDIEAGVNKLPIDLQKGVSGTYYVNWRSSNGNAGSLPIIKK
ncbi:T9SS type A sorting domain-containing protein [Chryseobacterium sediminis]|uniref:T9SS type A sorting domain-containing protein n=1 Tax=Chryseobacterium sediminis TaxID=1679494 RepID=A0A5B2U231_9FLAO|nr:T9SS type A sorting domain-containing protein [Chryseobacterium sediminis]KAA2220711.1 T9SS type A sorting domain-containing protein [Chryseobacterium sediminis]